MIARERTWTESIYSGHLFSVLLSRFLGLRHQLSFTATFVEFANSLHVFFNHVQCDDVSSDWKNITIPPPSFDAYNVLRRVEHILYFGNFSRFFILIVTYVVHRERCKVIVRDQPIGNILGSQVFQATCLVSINFFHSEEYMKLWQASRRVWGFRWERRDSTDFHPNVRSRHFWAATFFGVGTPILIPMGHKTHSLGLKESMNITLLCISRYTRWLF